MTRQNYIKAIEAAVKAINAFENGMNTACELSGVSNVNEWGNWDEIIKAITDEYLRSNPIEVTRRQYTAGNLIEAYEVLEFEGIEC